MPTISQFFLLQFSFISFSVFVLQTTEAHLEAHLSAKMAFSMTSRLR